MLTCINASRTTIRRSAISQLQRWSTVQLCRQQRTFHNTAINGERIQGLIYKENGDPRGKLEGHVWDIDTKNLKEGEIFVKIGHASVNPADFNVIQGVYPAKPEKQKLPGIEEEVWIGGNEGFGVVEKLSENGDLNGLKRGDWVIFSKPQIGTWRSGLICNANDVIKIPNRKESQITPYMASTLQVNPATAYRMLHDFHQLDPKKDVIVQNAANSAVGQAVAQIASRKLKVASINFIRSNAYSEELQKAFDSYSKGDESCKAYLFSYEHLADRNSGLKERIKTILGDRQIKLGLNAVCGQANADMAKLMSTNSTLITYGAMSRQPLTVPAGLIIFQNMAIRGFMMNKWYAQNGLKEREELLKTLVEMYKNKVILEPYSPKSFKVTPDHDAKQMRNIAKTLIENMMGQNTLKRRKIFIRFNDFSSDSTTGK